MHQYEISIPVSGYFRIIVSADSDDEAMSIANDQCSDADFGPLSDIDWSDGKIISKRPVTVPCADSGSTLDDKAQTGSEDTSGTAERYVLLGDHESDLCLLYIRNYDEGFAKALDEADQHWHRSDEEWHDIVYADLKAAGYDFDEVDFTGLSV